MRYSRSISLLLVIAFALMNAVTNNAQQQQSFEGFAIGIRPNAVKGEVIYQREDGKFDLEPGLKLQEGDFIRSSANAYAELLLHPGNYLRIGPETECQTLNDQHDRMRFKLEHGVMSFEILSREPDAMPSFSHSLKLAQELIRVITSNATVFISEPGIFRINAMADGRTELIVRSGEAVINGQRVKKKRIAIASRSDVTVAEVDLKHEDSFDLWARERAAQSVRANRLLKNESPWTGKAMEGQEMKVDFPDNSPPGGVVSVKPGVVNFAEEGVELNRPAEGWQQLTEGLELESGDKLRTSEHSFVEITVLPEMHLRLAEASELLFEQLANESISLKLLRGSAILDVARFDPSQGLPLAFGGPATSVLIAREGNYRVNITPKGDEITVREGKVIFNQQPVSACHTINGGKITECSKKRVDNFDFWSEYRGEGILVESRSPALRHLTALRRERFRNTGFWYQNPGQTTYVFVPFTSPHFRSPYGGNYSTVLSPRRTPLKRIDLDAGPTVRLPRTQVP